MFYVKFVQNVCVVRNMEEMTLLKRKFKEVYKMKEKKYHTVATMLCSLVCFC